MFESMFVITIYVAGIFSPVLVPATVHAVHAARGSRVAFRPRLTARFPRPVVARRLAVPATA